MTDPRRPESPPTPPRTSASARPPAADGALEAPEAAHFAANVVQHRLWDLRPRFRRRSSLLAFLAVMGPGLIAGVSDNDAGGIATYSVMGAQTGLKLLWLLPLTVVILVVVQEMTARLGVATGQGLAGLIRDRYGVRWTAFAMLVLLAANLANTVAEFAGAAAALQIFDIPPIVTVPVVAAAIWALVLFGSYRTVERAFLTVTVVFLAYIAAAIMARPDWGAVASALVTPTIDFRPSNLLLMVAIVGTTITPYMQFYLQSAVVEKGIDEEEMGLAQADAVLGAVWCNVIALFIVLAVASTLYRDGIQVQSAADAARALGPIAGPASTWLFAVGLLGASVLAATVMPISTAFVICEAFGWEAGVGRHFGDAPIFFGLYTFVLVAGALAVLTPGLPLIEVIVSSQYLQGLLIPIVLIFMLLLVNNRAMMGRHANGRRLNLVAGASIGLIILLDVVMLGSTVLGALRLIPAGV